MSHLETVIHVAGRGAGHGMLQGLRWRTLQTNSACELPVDFEAMAKTGQRIRSCRRRSGVAFIQNRRPKLCGPAQREALIIGS